MSQPPGPGGVTLVIPGYNAAGTIRQCRNYGGGSTEDINNHTYRVFKTRWQQPRCQDNVYFHGLGQQLR